MIWKIIAGRLLGQAISPDWEEMVTSLRSTNKSRPDIILLRLHFQCALYMIWSERNSRRHGKAWVTVEVLTRSIGKMVLVVNLHKMVACKNNTGQLRSPEFMEHHNIKLKTCVNTCIN